MSVLRTQDGAELKWNQAGGQASGDCKVLHHRRDHLMFMQRSGST